MTTYLFIGLILLLAAYLVRARRGRGGDSPSLTPKTARASRAPSRPPPPMPAAIAVAESAAAHAAPRYVEDPLPAPMAEPAMSWTPGETIDEPGWPLPGEISGGWSTAPSSPSAAFSERAPAATVVEWQPMAAAGADAHPAEAHLPGAGEWAVPPPDATGADVTGSGPPLWTPDAPAAETGAQIDTSAIWLAEPAAAVAPVDTDVAAWQPEAAEVPDAPPLEWGTPAAEPDAGAVTAGTPELAWASGPSIAPEPEPPASVWESPAAPADAGPEPVAEAEPEPMAEAEPEPEPATDPAGGETAATVPAAVPEWIAAAAPEHAAFTASVFGEPAPAEPLSSSEPAFAGPAPTESTAPADAAPEIPALATAWTEAPAPAAHEPAAAPAPLAGLVPLTSVCDHLGVTPRMLALMRVLADTPMSVSELARALSVSRPLVADLCTRLQAAGLAERERDDADRRRVRVVLTEAGHVLCAETATSPETGSYETVLAGLSRAERAQLRGMLQEMDGTLA